MIFLVVLASLLIAAITIYQYNEQAEDYHNVRLKRKEEAIKSAITYELDRDTINYLESMFLLTFITLISIFTIFQGTFYGVPMWIT